MIHFADDGRPSVRRSRGAGFFVSKHDIPLLEVPNPKRLIDNAARDLRCAAHPSCLSLLKALADQAMSEADARRLLGEFADFAVSSLVLGGLVTVGDVLALTRRGREVWMSVRSLVQ